MGDGYRDDHEAALRRADALERELESVRAELAEKEAALADASEQLEDRRREAERAGAHAKERAEAEAQLARLKREGEERHEAKLREQKQKQQPASRASPWRGRLLRLRSVVWGGEFWFSSAVVVFLVPCGVLSVWLTGVLRSRLDLDDAAYGYVLVGVAAAILLLPVAFGLVRLRLLERWVRTRPYEIVGYPDLLSLTPPNRDEGRLCISLEFEGSAPTDLGEILRGFDDELRCHRTGLSRPWPITKQFSKYGDRRANAETNWAVHRWIRRFEREVLRPLDKVSPLARVRFRATGLG